MRKPRNINLKQIQKYLKKIEGANKIKIHALTDSYEAPGEIFFSQSKIRAAIKTLIEKNISHDELKISITKNREFVLSIIRKNRQTELHREKPSPQNKLRNVLDFLYGIAPKNLTIDKLSKEYIYYEEQNLLIAFKTLHLNKAIIKILTEFPKIQPNEVFMTLNHENNCLDIYLASNLKKLQTIKYIGLDKKLNISNSKENPFSLSA